MHTNQNRFNLIDNFLNLEILTFILLLFNITFVTEIQAEATSWSMKDIEIAYTSKNYEELANNILSIPPSSRSKLWIEALRDTILYQIVNIQPGSRILVNLDTLELLKPYLNEDLLNYDFRIKVAEFLRLHTQRHANALEWFRYALNKDPSKEDLICQNPDLSLAVLDGLHLPASEKELVNNSIYFANLCYGRLHTSIKESLAEANDFGLTNICPILTDKKEPIGDLLKLKCADIATQAMPLN